MLNPRYLLLLLPLFAACNDEEPSEDLTTSVDKSGSVESSIAVSPLNGDRHVLTTTHKVWLHDSVYRTIIYYDTLPGLGKTFAEAENSDGDGQSVLVDKDYEIYITVK